MDVYNMSLQDELLYLLIQQVNKAIETLTEYAAEVGEDESVGICNCALYSQIDELRLYAELNNRLLAFRNRP